MTLPKKISLAALIIVVIIVACLSWLLASESGARFLLGRAQPYLPEELTLGGIRGSLIGGIRLTSLDWNSETADVAIHEISIEVEVARLLTWHLAVKSLDVAQVEIATRSATDTTSPGGMPSIDLPLRISIDSSSLRNLTITQEKVSRAVDEIRLSSSIEGSRLDVGEFIVRSNWLNVDLDGRIVVAGDYPGHIRVDWQYSASPSLQLAGELEARGDVRRYDVEHTLRLPQELSTQGQISYFDDVLEFNLSNAWAMLEWPVGDSLLTSSGITQGRLVASGAVRWQPTLSFDVMVGELGGRINDQPLAGGGSFAYSEGQITISNGRLQHGDNHLQLSGTVSDTLALDAQVEFPSIHELLPDASGSLSADIALRGSRERPEGRLEASGVDLSWSDYAIASLVIDAGVSPAQDLAISVNLEDAVVNDRAIDAVSLEATGNLGRHTLRTEVRSDGSNITAENTGAYLNGRWTGTVSSLVFDNPLAGTWSLADPAELVVSSDTVSISRACLERATEIGQACVQAVAASDRPTTFDLNISDLPISVFPLALPAEVTPSGFVDARVEGSVIENRVTGSGSISLRDARVDTVVDEETISAAFNKATVDISLNGNRAVTSLRLELADGVVSTALDLTIGDFMDAGSAVEGRGTVEMNDLSLFAVLLPDIARPRGSISGSVDISGSFGNPDLLGAIAISDSGFSFGKTGIEISDINARVVQLSAGRLQLEGSARSGDGEITIRGDTWASADSGVRSEFLITGHDFELSRLPDWQIAASPSIAIVLDNRVTSVTGNLFIPTTDVRVKDLPDASETASPDAIVHLGDESTAATRRRIDVDIAVGLGDEVRLAAFGLSTGLEGAVRIRGGTHEPYTGSGRLSLRDGRYEAYGQELEIERGQLIFNGPLDNPQLDVRAVRRMTDITAGIALFGTPSQLQSSLFSEPPLGDAETLSYLLTGRPLSDATSEGDGDKLNAAAFALGVSSAGNIVSQVRTGLGLDTLAVEGGADDGRLIAGKRIGNRLFVEYGYGLVDKLGTLLLRYKLSDRILLESRTGTISNFDILYRVKKD